MGSFGTLAGEEGLLCLFDLKSAELQHGQQAAGMHRRLSAGAKPHYLP